MYLIEPLEFRTSKTFLISIAIFKILKRRNIYVTLMLYSQNEIINILRLSVNYGN